MTNDLANEPDLPKQPALAPGEFEWSLLDTIRLVIRSRKKLAIATVLGLLLGVGLALNAKPYFSAQAVFLPPKGSDGPSSGAALIIGGSDLSDTYLGMLASRTVADDVIDHVGLMDEYKAKPDQRDVVRLILAGASKFSVDRNALIDVRITAGTPQLAARIANAYLDALYRLNGQMVTTASAHRRAFFEDQLAQQKLALSEAEIDLKNTQQRTGVVLPGGEAQAGLNATASLQADINATETRLAGLMSGETEQAPDVVQTRSQLAQLRAELARQQSIHAAPGAGIASNRQMPELQLEYEQKAREVKLRENVYDTLVQDYERARLSSIDPGPQLQLVDAAEAPVRKSGPSRKLMVLGGGAVFFGLTLLWILLAPPIGHFIRLVREPAATGRA